jgi:hypothetical protein
LDGPGAVVVGGMVFVNSGYSRFGGMPGNVRLAFAPKMTATAFLDPMPYSRAIPSS